MALTERDKIMLGKLRANYYLKPEEGRFYRKRDDRPVKGTQRKKKERYIVMNFSINGVIVHCQYHRAVWLYTYGEVAKVLDHIDGDPTNNRISNLRAVKHRENILNSVYQWKPNKDTGLPSISLSSKNTTWVHVMVNKKTCHFRNKYEAFYWVMFIGRFYREPPRQK